jgi:hypothetical protein
VKKQKTEGGMDISAVECWRRGLLEGLARSPMPPEDEINEARSEIMVTINTSLWNGESRECLKTWRTQSAEGKFQLRVRA